MKISVKFFASLREQLGQSEALIEDDSPLSVKQIWQRATSTDDLPDNTLCAINMEYVDSNAMVESDAEVAFFPPVTGG